MTLSEEEDVTRLLKKARKARRKAEKDPEAWPVCVKAYSDILRKFPHSVYLQRWSGDGKKRAGAWGLGVYRSTAGKVNEELAALPPAGRAVYRAVNDPAARNLFVEAREHLDERGMERVAQTYFSTSWGDQALHWLGEAAYDRGVYRLALTRLQRIARHPDPDAPKVAVLARIFLAQYKAGLRLKAKASLKALAAALKDPKNGVLRVGHLEGQAALASLRKRLTDAPLPPAAAGGSARWETYFGNAAHHQPLPPKGAIGVRKWSESILRLLGAPKGTKDRPFMQVRWYNQAQKVALLSRHLVVRGGWFFLCGYRSIACHSVNNPNPERPKFWYPSRPPPPKAQTPNARRFGGQAIASHPHFVTLGGERLFAILGSEPLLLNQRFWGGNRPKQKPNWIVALGKKSGGTMGVESGWFHWSLEPGEGEAFKRQSKADREWLQGVYFTNAPTYADGTLYVMAVTDSGGSREAWVAAFDAATGRLLWKTLVCSAQPVFFNTPVQPDLGLPVAVSAGTVYCVTNLGAVAALDASTGQVRWIRIYERIENAANNNRGQRVASLRDYWGPNPPIVAGDLLIATPQDSPYLYAFDVQSGRRVWQTERVSDAGTGAPGDAERLKHILGIANGRLVLSGRDILFIDLKGGRREHRKRVRDEYDIWGRGVVTQEEVLVPTNKALLRISTKPNPKSGKPSYKLLEERPWKDPRAEAGNLFLAGDVLFSVSATHVNAYFVLEQVEKKIQARIKAEPGNLANYLELGDVRHRAGAFDKAIEAFNKGLEVAARHPEDASAKARAAELRAGKFEAYFAAGEALLARKKPDPASAYKKFEAALQGAETPDQPVRALWKMAEARLASKQPAEAVLLFQRLLSERGEVVYGFGEKSSSKAAVYAQRRIAGIKQRFPKALEKLEAMAQAALAKARRAEGAAGLEAVIRRFPNTAAYGEALLALGGRLLKEGQPERARLYYRRFLLNFRRSPKRPEALAHLALAYEQSGLLGAARGMLRKLVKNPALAGRKISVAGAAPQAAGAWAAARLKEARYQTTPSSAFRRMGNGRLHEMWSKSMGASLTPLGIRGRPPKNMLGQTFFAVEGRLMALNGADGEEAWKPRPELPAGFKSHLCAWSGRFLITAGSKEVRAYDSTQKGKLAWSFPLNPNTESGGGRVGALLAADQRVSITQQGGRLSVLDAQSGRERWHLSVPGGNGKILNPPAQGEGFLAVGRVNQSPAVITLYETETGLKRLDLKLPKGKLLRPPLAVGEALYTLGSDNHLRAFNAGNGKLLWAYDLKGPAIDLQADYDVVVAVMKTLELVACDPNAEREERRLKWKTIPGETRPFAGLIVDGEDVFLASKANNRRGEVTAYDAGGGRLRWKADTAGRSLSARENLARRQLLVTQSTFDPQGALVTAAGLLDRRSGKLVWVKELSTQRSFTRAFDGGLVVGDGRALKGFLALDPEKAAQELQAIRQKAAASPADIKLRLQLAHLQHRKGDLAQALATLLPLLSNEHVDEPVFAEAFERFSRYRKALAKKVKRELKFARVQTAPKIDGDLSDWKAMPGTRLDSWRHVFLAGEEDKRQPLKRENWKGPADLSVVFKGTYDEQNLYVAVRVRDQTHVNRQTRGSNCWNGDSLQLAFDLERDTRRGFYGNDFELGVARNGQGKVLTWKWVERSRFIMKPLSEARVSVVRDEVRKETRYELALPLKFLALKPGKEKGKDLKFGFTFMVNDIDTAKNVEKGIAPSPGIWNPKYPGQYSTGVLTGKP